MRDSTWLVEVDGYRFDPDFRIDSIFLSESVKSAKFGVPSVAIGFGLVFILPWERCDKMVPQVVGLSRRHFIAFGIAIIVSRGSNVTWRGHHMAWIWEQAERNPTGIERSGARPEIS